MAKYGKVWLPPPPSTLNQVQATRHLKYGKVLLAPPTPPSTLYYKVQATKHPRNGKMWLPPPPSTLYQVQASRHPGMVKYGYHHHLLRHYTRYKPAGMESMVKYGCHQRPPPLLPEDPPADKGRCYSSTLVLGKYVMLVIILYLKANKSYLLVHLTRRTTWSLTYAYKER